MNQKHLQKIYHANVYVNLILENVTEIKSGITINRSNKKYFYKFLYLTHLFINNHDTTDSC